jgi:hypothetical protein
MRAAGWLAETSCLIIKNHLQSAGTSYIRACGRLIRSAASPLWVYAPFRFFM